MRINGDQYDYEEIILDQLLRQLSLNPEVVVAEVNGLIVPKSDFETYIVDKEAIVELVAFVGGG